MEIFKVINGEDPVETLIKGIEKQVGSTIFTFKVLEREDLGMKVIIVFGDKRVLYGHIVADLNVDEEKLGLRIKADFI